MDESEHRVAMTIVSQLATIIDLLERQAKREGMRELEKQRSLEHRRRMGEKV